MRRANILFRLLVTIVLLFTLEATRAAAASPKGKGGNQGGNQSAWEDDFNGNGVDRNRWVIASGQAPGYLAGNHIGYYDPAHVSVQNGYLVISLTQESGAVDNVPGAISQGGLIYTKDTYGYGTYEWTMRMSSTSPTPTGLGVPVSGSVSAGFNYVNNSQTEIDFEFAGHLPGWLYMSNWYNRNTRRDPTDSDLTDSRAAVSDISTTFKTYKFVWEKGRITFYINGVFQTSHLTDVPSAPAHFMINHWGTNNPWWGGTATIGITRYFYVDWVRYTPAP
ncbi:MAG: glycoside hydrolase family 16 protein [Acidobacteria bacterium]|nr:glycoside hydrolase family 16 protein [Acidobacteriota bacterium]